MKNKIHLPILITGSTGFEALFHQKPVILFADEYFDCLSMITKVDTLTDLPNLISKCLTSYQFNNKEFNVLMKSTESKSILLPYFQIMKDALIISSIQRNEKNSVLTEKTFNQFYDKYVKDFKILGNEFKKNFSS